jgi:G3E family GTPase
VHLDRLICVADATHVLDDFQRDDYLAVRDAEAGPKPTMTARALLMAMQFEYASTIIFVGWESLTTPELTTVMALVSHLSPRASLWLDRRTIEHVGATDPTTPSAFRPGWVGVLNDEFDPHMTDRRVSAFRYEQVRPLHPARLMALLDRVEAGEFGNVVRSAGFCRLATRPHITAQWEHVGRMISLEPLTSDERLVEGEELLAVGQDIAFIGIDVDQDALAAALDDVALTDDELAEGPAAWAGFEDPFPVWQTASDWAD